MLVSFGGRVDAVAEDPFRVSISAPDAARRVAAVCRQEWTVYPASARPATGGTKVEATATVSADATYYAHWSEAAVDWWEIETW